MSVGTMIIHIWASQPVSILVITNETMLPKTIPRGTTYETDS